MNARMLLAAWPILSLALGCSSTSHPRATSMAADVLVAEPMAYLAGADSAIQEAGYQRITTATEWQQLRRRHLADEYDRYYGPQFEVDFSRYEIVAIFAGSQQNTRGIAVHAMAVSADTTQLRFRVLGYQTVNELELSSFPSLQDPATLRAESTRNAKLDPPRTPFAFVLLSKSTRTIVLEEDQQALLGQPPAWVEVARLPAS